MCVANPCDCDWSNYDNFEEGSTDLVQIAEAQCDGDDRPCPVPTVTDVGSSIFDCVSSFSGYPRDGESLQRNPNIIGDMPIFEIGDLVRYYPVHGFNKPRQVWIVKSILNPNLMDSGWFDYEITDGMENHNVTKYELFRLRDADEKQ
jgi:hypothetical protein